MEKGLRVRGEETDQGRICNCKLRRWNIDMLEIDMKDPDMLLVWVNSIKLDFFYSSNSSVFQEFINPLHPELKLC